MNDLSDDRSPLAMARLASAGKDQPDDVTLVQRTVKQQSGPAFTEIGQLGFQSLTPAEVIDQDLAPASAPIESAHSPRPFWFLVVRENRGNAGKRF